jgi:type IV secretion system protein VirB11
MIDELKQDPLLRNNMIPLMPYLISGTSDICINKAGEIIIHFIDGTKVIKTDRKLNLRWLKGFSRLMVNRSGESYDDSINSYGFEIPGGHRVQLVKGNEVESKFALSIRVKNRNIFSLDNFVINDKEALIGLVHDKKNILISGGTGSGKTSFLNSLIKYIPENERVITLEDVSELTMNRKDKLSLLYKNDESARRLLNAVLRLNPDRIISGEIRQFSAMTFYRALNTGHPGSMATIHANNADEAFESLIDHMVANGDVVYGAYEIVRKRLKRLIDASLELKRVGSKVLVNVVIS